MAQVLKAVGNAVGDAVDKIQEVTGLGKDEKASEQRDVQAEGDQAPAGVDEAGADAGGPEFTTTSKETDPSSGEEAVTTTQDDVPLPDEAKETQEVEETQPEPAQAAEAKEPEPEAAQDAEPPKQEDTKPIPAAEPSQPSPSAAESGDSGSPSSAPRIPPTMNQLPNRGGGSVALPRTSKKWKQDSSSWYPDAAGVQHPPGFFIHKRRHPALV